MIIANFNTVLSIPKVHYTLDMTLMFETTELKRLSIGSECIDIADLQPGKVMYYMYVRL